MAEKKVELLREITLLDRKEIILKNQNANRETPQWKLKIEEKVPKKLSSSLEKAFCMAFSLIFKKGTSIIEKSYNKEDIKQDYEVHKYALELNSKRELRHLRQKVLQNDLINTALTSIEGAALGAAGIGMPDIVIFVTILLRNIYEGALRFGFQYDTPAEQLIILKMIECALCKSDEFDILNSEIDTLVKYSVPYTPTENELKEQIQKTAKCMAMDMLVLKFIQGMPIIGVIGGLSNGVYYRRIMKYVNIKYQKRHLFELLKDCK